MGASGGESVAEARSETKLRAKHIQVTLIAAYASHHIIPALTVEVSYITAANRGWRKRL